VTLTNRLSATFLGALALVLVGFSTALYVMASVYLHRSVDDRLEATLTTLAALAEDEPGGLDWEQDQRRSFPGQEHGSDHVRWVVLDEWGVEVGRSKNLGSSSKLEETGPRRVDARRHPWRVVERRLQTSHPATSEGEHSKNHRSLVLRAGLRLDPIERVLQTLALTLALLSMGLWGVTALIGRRLCRSALAPLTRMASASRELGAEEPGQRLPQVKTNDELEDLAVAFNGLLDRWQEALERQSRFAGDASHQLRTPLTALIGQVDVALRRDRPVEDYRGTLRRVRDQAERLRRIVEAILFLARADAEAGLPALEPIDLSTWTSEQIRRRADEGSGDNLRWVEPLESPPLVRAHPALLAEVLDNLLDNARDHSPAGAPVEVQLSTEPGWVVLLVEDQGRGIASADLPRIFEPFYRAAEARRAVPSGVGLGLAVARRIVLAMGGRLEVESQVGKGSQFQLRLPEDLATTPANAPTVKPHPVRAQPL
jgi:two-component system, OmpR family, sensor kinase